MGDANLRKDAARNRDKLVRAARELFAERGLDATLNDVARRAGVGVGTAYRRFADKHQLIDAILDEQDAELEAIARAALAEPDPWDGLVMLLERSTELHARDRGMAQILSGRHVRKERHDLSRDRLAHLGEEIVARAKTAGVIRDDVEATDLILMQIACVAVAQVAADGTAAAGRNDVGDLYRRTLEIMIDGLRPARAGITPLPIPPLATEELHSLLQPNGP
jgi:AcrR family transcriptional regulator